MSRLMTVREIADSAEYPFTLGQIRAWLFHRNTNGLARAVRKLSPRRLYIDQDDFEAWIRETTESSESSGHEPAVRLPSV